MRWRIIGFLRPLNCVNSLFNYYGQIQDGGRRPCWTYLNRNNSAADCSILLKSGMWVLYERRKLRNCWICRMMNEELRNSNAERLARLLILILSTCDIVSRYCRKMRSIDERRTLCAVCCSDVTRNRQHATTAAAYMVRQKWQKKTCRETDISLNE